MSRPCSGNISFCRFCWIMNITYLWTCPCRQRWLLLTLLNSCMTFGIPPWYKRSTNITFHSSFECLLRHKHFLAGLLLRELDLESGQEKSKAMRTQAIITLRNLLKKHDADERYATKETKQRIAGLYFPYLLLVSCVTWFQLVCCVH